MMKIICPKTLATSQKKMCSLIQKRTQNVHVRVLPILFKGEWGKESIINGVVTEAVMVLPYVSSCLGSSPQLVTH